MSRALTTALFLIAATASAQTKPRPDAEGVPLPDGAIARLGSSRFRFDGTPMCPVVFSTDGKQVAVGSAHSVSIFESATGRQLHRLSLPAEHYPRLVRFLADGKRLAVGSAGGKAGELNVYDLADGMMVATSKLPGKNQILIADVTPDGSRVLVVDWFAKVYLWDVKAEREVWAFDHKEPAYVKPFTADGKHFVAAGYRRSELHDAETGKVVGPFPDPGPGYRDRFQAAMSPDGRIALGIDKGDAVVVLAAQGTDRLRTLASERRAERFFFSPDSRYLVAPMPAGTQVWDLTTPDDKGPIARLPGASGGGFSPDGKTLALADEGFITLWIVGDWKQLPQLADPDSPVHRVGFTPDGKRVLGYTRAGWVTWPAAGGPAARVSDGSAIHFPIHSEGFAGVSADGRVGLDVLHEHGNGRDQGKFALRVTDLTTGKDRCIPLDGSPWTPIQISPDGKFVSASVQGSEFIVWNAATGEVLHRMKRPAKGILFGATPAPDGKGLALSAIGIAGEGNRGFGEGPLYSSITVTNHQTGHAWTMDPIPWSVYSGGARFSKDGSRVVLQGRFERGYEKDSVTVWDVTTGRQLMRWDRESGRIESVALSADNRSLLAGTLKGQLAQIEVATGGERANFQHGGQVLSSAFHPDGTKAVSSSPDAPVYVWDLIGDPGKWDITKADAVWADLASSDAKIGFASIRKLRANPSEAVAFLKDRLKAQTAPADETVAKWLKGLDAAAFAEREKSQRELTAVADLVRPKLEAARKTASEEARRRLDQVLKSTEEWTPDKLRQFRACEVLEGVGTPEAMKVLRAWAAGPDGARLTTEAKESVGRKRP